MSNEIGYGSGLLELIDTLAARTAAAGKSMPAFAIREKPLLELTNVRGDARSSALKMAIQQVFEVALPTVPNTVTVSPTHAALWLGPDEWLLESGAPRLPTAERMSRPLLSNEHAAVVDVSSSYTVVELSGSRVREILQKGCPLDLHPRVFSAGQCAQSHFFRAGVILRPLDTDRYELIVRRSFADYVVRMLLDAAEL